MDFFPIEESVYKKGPDFVLPATLRPVWTPFSSAASSGFSAASAGFLFRASLRSGQDTGGIPIRPKTVRLKPRLDWPSTEAIKSLKNAEMFHEEILTEKANLVEFSELPIDQFQAYPTQFTQQTFPTIEPSSYETAMDMEGVAGAHVLSSCNQTKTSYDGYNWRKYGQKQVKGSEHPRAYYKCTHPTCRVKKKVKKSVDGEIIEIIYEGDHNHPKSVPYKSPSFSSSAMICKASASLEAGAKSGGRLNEMAALASLEAVWDGKFGEFIIDYEAGSSTNDAEAGKRSSKRRKNTRQAGGEARVTEEVQDPPTAQSYTESHASMDGYQWRKYGRKVVKGSTFPRSYYKCTNLNCNARKHVERTSDESGSFVTTYEGKHNHDETTVTAVATNRNCRTY